MVTTLDSAAVAEILRAAGLPTEVEPDTTAYLRSHAAFVVPTMVAAQWMWGRTHAVRWSDATRRVEIRPGHANVRRRVRRQRHPRARP